MYSNKDRKGARLKVRREVTKWKRNRGEAAVGGLAV